MDPIAAEIRFVAIAQVVSPIRSLQQSTGQPSCKLRMKGVTMMEGKGILGDFRALEVARIEGLS